MFSFIWDMTRWNRLDIKIATGKKKKKKYRYFVCTLKKFGSLGVHSTMPVTIDLSCLIISPMIMGCELFSIDHFAWHCVRQGCRICSKCKQKLCTFERKQKSVWQKWVVKRYGCRIRKFSNVSICRKVDQYIRQSIHSTINYTTKSMIVLSFTQFNYDNILLCFWFSFYLLLKLWMLSKQYWM